MTSSLFTVSSEPVGQRGHTATAMLHDLGVQARNLDGGYKTWAAATAAKTGDTKPLWGYLP